MTKIAVIAGSLRAGSTNHQLADTFAALAPADVTFEHLDVGALPLFNPELLGARPEPVERYQGTLESADGLLIVSPEYNRAVPGFVANALDWASQPQPLLKRKPVAIAGTSPGKIGTAAMQVELRSRIVALGGVLMPTPQMFYQWNDADWTEDGTPADGDTKAFFQSYTDAVVDWVRG